MEKKRGKKRFCGRGVVHAYDFVQFNLLDLLTFRFRLSILRTGRVVPLFSPCSLCVLAVKVGIKRVILQIEHGLPNWSTWVV